MLTCKLISTSQGLNIHKTLTGTYHIQGTGKCLLEVESERKVIFLTLHHKLKSNDVWPVDWYSN